MSCDEWWWWGGGEYASCESFTGFGVFLVLAVLLVFDSCFGCPTLKDRCHICTFMLKLMPV